LNLNENVIKESSFRLNPDEFHCSNINLIIKAELLLLSTKKGSDKITLGSD
jgi:ABC-type siderophore export system fused ATPase/permease subunit